MGERRDPQPPAPRGGVRARGGGPLDRRGRRARRAGGPLLRAAHRAGRTARRAATGCGPSGAASSRSRASSCRRASRSACSRSRCTIEAPERALVYPAVDPVPIPRDFGGVRESGESVRGSARPRRRGRRRARVRSAAIRRAGSPGAPRCARARSGCARWRASTRARWRCACAPRTAPADARFERDVRGSASEVAALLERGLRVGLRTDRDAPRARRGRAQRARLLGFLARVRARGPARAGRQEAA